MPQIDTHTKKRVQIVSLFSIDSSPDVIIVNMFAYLYPVLKVSWGETYRTFKCVCGEEHLSSCLSLCVPACPCMQGNCFITLQFRVANKRNTQARERASNKANRCHVKCTWTQMIYFNVLFFSLRHFLMIDSWAGKRARQACQQIELIRQITLSGERGRRRGGSERRR